MRSSAPTQRSRSAISLLGRFVSFLILTATFLLITATLRAQSSSVRVEDFSLQPGGVVKIENASGSTRVEAWRGDTVRVVAEKVAPANSSLGLSDLMLMGAGNTVVVQTRQTSAATRIDLTVYVPQLSQLSLAGGASPVNVTGALAAAVVQTTSGNIDYKLPADDDARVSMRTGKGVVRSTVPLNVSERSATSLQGQLRNGLSAIILNSQTGNITLAPGPNAGLVGRNIPTDESAIDDSDQPHRSNQQGVSNSQDESADLSAGGSRAPSRTASRGSSNPSAGNNGSFVFGGSDQGVDAQQSTKTGKFNRPRTQRNTSGGDSGLKVRIIPS